jgi:putative transposase
MAESPSAVPPYNGFLGVGFSDGAARVSPIRRNPASRHAADMPNYRRFWVPGGTWFFTVNLLKRRENDLLVREIGLLRECVARERSRRPFSIVAWVALPDHMHWIWRLPDGDADFATRWRRIKTDFSLGLANTEHRCEARRKRGERGIWQRRYWEHAICDQTDLQRHVDYVHYNPVKHGLVDEAADWPHSSLHRHIERHEKRTQL